MRASVSSHRDPTIEAPRQWLQAAGREIIRPDEGYSVRWAQHGFPEVGVPRWNYHPEYELHLIRHSEGRFVIGDKVGVFGPGQVWLIGPGLPHDWVSFVAPGEHIAKRDTLIQFSDEWFAGSAATMPELDKLRPRLRESRNGLYFLGDTANRLGRLMDRMGEQEGIARLATLMSILERVADAPASEVTNLEANYARPREGPPSFMETVDIGLDYILNNMSGPVLLSIAASRASMSESAFSRYFKSASGLTFTEMTSKLRVSQACRLLDVGDDSIASIAQQVGYANLSNFNRQFRRIAGVTPREYRTLARSKPSRAESYHY
jgi:AraC-like DNA-binding protein/mannose-6-phosphate isomerase-like protein (cupin superfamily)